MNSNSILRTRSPWRIALWSMLTLLLTLFTLQVNAQSAVIIGSQVKSKNLLISGKAYLLQYTTNNPYIEDKGDHYDVPKTGNTANEACVYYLYDDGNDTWKIKNYYTGKYWPAGANQTELVPTDDEHAGSWSLTFDGSGNVTPKSNNYGLDRNNPNLVSWSTSSNKTIRIYEIAIEPVSITSGWYQIRWIDIDSDTNTDYNNEGVSGKYVKNYGQDVTIGSTNYPLYLDNAPTTLDECAASMVYFEKDGSSSGRGVDGYLRSSNGHYVTNTGAASTTASSKNYIIYRSSGTPYLSVITSAYTGTRNSLVPRGKDATPYIGITANNKFPVAEIYAINPSDLGLQPWTVCLADDGQVTYTGSNAYGVKSFYNGGTLFLTTGVTPTASDFTYDESYVRVVVNTDRKTITFQKTPLTNLNQLESGWYQMKFTNTKTDKYVYNNANENNYSASVKYPLTYQETAEVPADNNGLYYIRFVRNGDNVQIQSTNGHYLGVKGIANETAQDLNVIYDNGFRFGGYLYPYGSGATNIVGGTDANSTARFALYPVIPEENSLTAWRVIIANNANAGALTCTRGDVSGLTTVYEGGYFILPSNVTPIASDFTMTDLESVTINTEDKTITALLPDINGVTTSGGHQTTGVNNTNAVLERIKIETVNNTIKLSQMTATLKGDTKDRVSRVAVYKTPGSQFKPTVGTDTQTLLGATTNLASDNITITLDDEITLSAGDYLWLVADINNDNTLIGTTIDAKVTGFTYTSEHVTTPAVYEIDTDPAGVMTIFKTQSFVFTPNRTETEYYRIPAIITTADGDIIALADQRHDHPYDLGKNASNGTGTHVIDVVARKSTNGGLTWGDIATIATGDGTNAASYGYGDPAIVRDANGTLHCMMAAGSSSYANGMLHVGYTKSTDNGATWSTPTDLYADIDKNGLTGITSFFVTSGKGVLAEDGTLMFAALCKVSGTTHIYVMKSEDNGATWTLESNPGYTGGDESKLIERLDGSLMMSIRTGAFNSAGNRGFNISTDKGATWGTQYQNSTLWGNGSDHDIIYYKGASSTAPKGIMLHTMCNSDSREKLSLYMSVDAGMRWSKVYEIQEGLSAYSNLQKLSNGDVAVLYEDGSIRDVQDEYAINYLVLTSTQLDAWAAPLIAAIQSSANDITYEQAMEAIVPGAQYYITTTEGDGTKRYISASGWSQTDVANAGTFTFTQATGGAYKAIGWNLYIDGSSHFTNAGESVDGHIHTTTSNNRDTWERQVFFLNAETGKYAIRSTNAADNAGYRCNAYWYVHSYNDGNGAFWATDYDLVNLGTPHFVWNLEPVGGDEELNYTRALNEIENGAVYQIKTVYDEVTYYLKSDGTLSTTASEACNFVIGEQSVSGYKSKGWRIFTPDYCYSFTNVANQLPDGAGGNLRLSNYSSNDRGTYDGQVLYYNGSKFAVRASNVTDANWQGNCHWGFDDGKAVYLNDGAHYIWDFVKVADAPAFTPTQTYRIKSASQNLNFISAGTTSGANVPRSTDENLAGEFLITPDANKINGFYVFDIKSGLWLTAPSGNSEAAAWTYSSTKSSIVLSNNSQQNVASLNSEATASGKYYIITNISVGVNPGTGRGLASTYGGGASGQVKNYTSISDTGCNWLITAIDNPVSASAAFIGEYNKPNNTYYIKNEGNGKFISKTPEAETNNAKVAESSSDAATFLIIPVSGQSGYYYLYDVQSGKYLVPDNDHGDLNNSHWTWSANPTIVQVRNNFENSYQVGGLLYTLGANRAANGTYSAATSGDYVGNFQQGNPYNLALNHWYIVKAGADAVVELNGVTSAVSAASIQSLVRSAAAAGTQLQYTATVGTAARGTLVIPFDADVPGETVEAYTLESVDRSDHIHGTKVTTIERNKPVLLKNEGSIVLTAKSGTLAYTENPTNGLLHGVYTRTAVPNGSYVLQNQAEYGVAFYLVNTSVATPSVNAFRAYLTAGSNTARALTFSFGEETTGINSIDNGQLIMDNGAVYDLQGRKVSEASASSVNSVLPKGLYIINGKKVVIK